MCCNAEIWAFPLQKKKRLQSHSDSFITVCSMSLLEVQQELFQMSLFSQDLLLLKELKKMHYTISAGKQYFSIGFPIFLPPPTAQNEYSREINK